MSLSTAPSHQGSRYRVPLVRVVIPDLRGNFTRNLDVPLYELPLHEKRMEGALPPGKGIEIMEVPAHMPESHRYDYRSFAEERSRLASLFEVHPITKTPIFDEVYPGTAFRQAFADVVEKRLTLEKALKAKAEAKGEEDLELDAETEPVISEEFQAPEGVEPGKEREVAASQANDERDTAVYKLRKVRGVGPELAADIYDRFGVKDEVELAECTPEMLETIDGIGPKNAVSIIRQARLMGVGEVNEDDAPSIQDAVSAFDDDDDEG